MRNVFSRDVSIHKEQIETSMSTTPHGNIVTPLPAYLLYSY